MKKINLKKELKPFYGTTAKQGIVVVDVPKMNFLMVDGVGDPNTAKAYSEAIASLFALAYKIKFMIKTGPLAIDYGVMPLETLWWADDMADFSQGDKSNWKWTTMIMQPEWVTSDMVEKARAEVAQKKQLLALPDLRLETFAEGSSAQCLHTGPYAEEAPTIAALHQFIADSGHVRRGKHHEIYLSDMRRTDPSKLKTIIRQPVEYA